MIKVTIGDLLDEKLDNMDIEGHYIYIVRDSDVIFYIGQSKDPVRRLLGHCGRGDWIFGGKSALGMLLEANLPEARQWQIELLTIADCEPYVKLRWWSRWTTKSRERLLMLDRVIESCEQALIDHYRPCLNSMGNPHPTSLPEQVAAREREYFDYPLVIMPWDNREEKP